MKPGHIDSFGIQAVHWSLNLKETTLQELSDETRRLDQALIVLVLRRGGLRWQIPELGIKTVKYGEWCLLSDHTASSSVHLNDTAEGILLRLPIHILEKGNPLSTNLPPKLHCVICPQRDVALFLKGPSQGRVAELVDTLLLNKSPHGLTEEWLHRSLICELIARVFERPELRKNPDCENRICESDRQTLEAIARNLQANLGDCHSLRDLARRHHINEFKLKKGFKAHFGTTVFNYLRRQRMERARMMLSKKEGSIIEVANSVGYTNPSHFARAFRTVHGINPGEFARRVRAEDVPVTGG